MADSASAVCTIDTIDTGLIRSQLLWLAALRSILASSPIE